MRSSATTYQRSILLYSKIVPHEYHRYARGRRAKRGKAYTLEPLVTEFALSVIDRSSRLRLRHRRQCAAVVHSVLRPVAGAMPEGSAFAVRRGWRSRDAA